MAAYVIVEVEVNDPVRYEDYKAQAEATIAMYGGEYIVRGGNPENVEGDWRPSRIVVLKFADREKAKTWLYSAEYSEPRKLRHATAKSRMILIDGV